MSFHRNPTLIKVDFYPNSPVFFRWISFDASCEVDEDEHASMDAHNFYGLFIFLLFSVIASFIFLAIKLYYLKLRGSKVSFCCRAFRLLKQCFKICLNKLIIKLLGFAGSIRPLESTESIRIYTHEDQCFSTGIHLGTMSKICKITTGKYTFL